MCIYIGRTCQIRLDIEIDLKFFWGYFFFLTGEEEVQVVRDVGDDLLCFMVLLTIL